MSFGIIEWVAFGITIVFIALIYYFLTSAKPE